MEQESHAESHLSSVGRSFQKYHGDLQRRHKQQLDVIDKLVAHAAKVRSSLLDAHSAELGAVQQLMRLVEWKIGEADGADNGERKADESAVGQQ